MTFKIGDTDYSKKLISPYKVNQYKEYDEFIIKDKTNLAISKNGCVYNATKHRIEQLDLNSDGKYSIHNKNGYEITIEKLIAYTFFQSKCNLSSIKIDTIAQAPMFTNYDNIII